jgi:hypothetical protein
LPTPRGLSQAPTSFIGSRCQGIHHAPLPTCHHKPPTHPTNNPQPNRPGTAHQPHQQPAALKMNFRHIQTIKTQQSFHTTNTTHPINRWNSWCLLASTIQKSRNPHTPAGHPHPGTTRHQECQKKHQASDASDTQQHAMRSTNCHPPFNRTGQRLCIPLANTTINTHTPMV